MDSTGDFARSADLRRASEEVIARLEGLGISLNGDESPESLILVLEEVERFAEPTRRFVRIANGWQTRRMNW
jgi:hypothetical protein